MGGLRDANMLGRGVSDGEHILEANDAFLESPATPGKIWPPDALSAGPAHPRGVSCGRSTADAMAQLQRIPGPAARTKRNTCTGTGTGSRSSRRRGRRPNPTRSVVGFAVDLTARQRAEREREELQARERAARAAGRARPGTAQVPAPGGQPADRGPGPARTPAARRPAGGGQPGRLLPRLPADRRGGLRATSIAHRGPARPRCRLIFATTGPGWMASGPSGRLAPPAPASLGWARLGLGGPSQTRPARVVARHRLPGWAPSTCWPRR